MGFFKQLKEVCISVLPIALIAIVLGLFLSVFEATIPIWQFLLSVLFVIIGLTLFLLGVNLGFVPVGNKLGSYITGKKNIWLLLSLGFLLGVIITIAEPDVTVLAEQVVAINPAMSKVLLIIMIALGVGIMMAASYLREVAGFSLKLAFLISVIVIFLVARFVPEFFVSIAFDSGGATTGPMAVPFIMALGLGVSATHGAKEEDSFGYTGLASFGPVLFVLLLGLFANGSFTNSVSASESLSMLEVFIIEVKDVSIALSPLIAICLIVQFFIMKLPRIQAFRLFSGIVYTWIGVILFLFSVKSSFMPVASALGEALANCNESILILTGLILGSAVVLAEPAIWLLTEQVEEVSQGRIKRTVMLAFISIGVALAVVLSLVRVVHGLSIWCFLLPGYALILALMPFCQTLFVAIAFDSGGVATGPMSSTFLLPFTTGVASVLAVNASEASFGMIGLIAMMPIISIEILGVIVNVIIKKSEKKGVENG